MSDEKEFKYHLIPCPHCNQSASYQMTLGHGCSASVSCRYCHKTIKIRTNMNAQIERIEKDFNGGVTMKKCPNCGKELKDTAKFCGSCGTKLDEVKATNRPDDERGVNVASSYIHWNILPGQIAVKIDERDIASYGKVKGLVVQDGVKALFFVQGKIVAQLEAGQYAFKDYANAVVEEKEEKKRSLIGNFFHNVANFFKGGASDIIRKTYQVSIVLVRSTEFPLLFNFENVETAGIRSNVGIHLLIKVSNINDFYTNQLLDKKMLCYETVAKSLESTVLAVLNESLSGTEPQKVSTKANDVLLALQNRISELYPYFSASKIINLTASREELENIRKMQEELYISELELTELTKRNNFLNRLHDENNAQTLAEARSETDFQAALDKIDEDRELNEDERLKFSQMLEAQRMIREAKTEDEVQAGIQEYKKSGLLREEEIENIQAQITQNASLRDLTYGQELALATLANEKELDRQKLLWETEIGNARLQNELAQERMRAEYLDERERQRTALEAEKARTELELQKERMASKLDVLRQAQEIRQQREQAEHERQMEANAQKIQHEEEMRRMFQNMTAEQILVANPNITPEAANAMAEKFKAELAASQNDKTAEMAMKQSEQMQAFMQQQMAMMRDVTMAGLGANAQNQAQRLSDKDAEINRFANGVNNAVNSVSSALKNPQTVYQTGASSVTQSANDAKAVLTCPNCGTPHEEGALFCESCGGSL